MSGFLQKQFLIKKKLGQKPLDLCLGNWNKFSLDFLNNMLFNKTTRPWDRS
jgi:hypothetical protein